MAELRLFHQFVTPQVSFLFRSQVTGMVYLAYGAIFAKATEGFSKTDLREHRHDGDRNAVWRFIVAVKHFCYWFPELSLRLRL